MYHDIIEESWVYQEILQKGVQQERQEELRNQSQLLLAIVQARFPEMLDLAQKQMSTFTDLASLRDLLFKISTAQNAQEVSYALHEVGKQEKK